MQVLNLPWPRHDQPIDMEQILLQPALPEGAMYLRCERLKVLDTPADPKTGRLANKEMEGNDNVYPQQGKD